MSRDIKRCLSAAAGAGYMFIQDVAERRNEMPGHFIRPLDAGDQVRLVEVMLKAAWLKAHEPIPDDEPFPEDEVTR